MLLNNGGILQSFYPSNQPQMHQQPIMQQQPIMHQQPMMHSQPQQQVPAQAYYNQNKNRLRTSASHRMINSMATMYRK